MSVSVKTISFFVVVSGKGFRRLEGFFRKVCVFRKELLRRGAKRRRELGMGGVIPYKRQSPKRHSITTDQYHCCLIYLKY